MKNDALGASCGPLGASRSPNGKKAAPGLRKGRHFTGKIGFRVPFWTPVDFEGGPQISRLRTEPPQNDAKSAQAGRGEKVKQFDVKVVSKCQALHGGNGAPV